LSVEESFAKLLGRPPNEKERQRLAHIRDALGVRENDAFWAIIVAYELYDSLFAAYPTKIAEEARFTIERAREAYAVAAEAEAAKCHNALAIKVAETSVEIAKKLAEKPIGIHQVTALLAGVVAFGALCLACGFKLATTSAPFWGAGADKQSAMMRAMSFVLRVPAGWMLFLLVVPGAWYGARSGWTLIRDSMGDAKEKALGWVLLGAAALSVLACVVLLAKIFA
jgi:hypothetical protein